MNHLFGDFDTIHNVFNTIFATGVTLAPSDPPSPDPPLVCVLYYIRILYITNVVTMFITRTLQVH